MEMKPVQSSNIAAIGYDPKEATLRVEFKSHGIYDYSGVDFKTYQALINAESVGKTFTETVKGKFGFKKHEPKKEKKDGK